MKALKITLLCTWQFIKNKRRGEKDEIKNDDYENEEREDNNGDEAGGNNAKNNKRSKNKNKLKQNIPSIVLPINLIEILIEWKTNKKIRLSINLNTFTYN